MTIIARGSLESQADWLGIQKPKFSVSATSTPFFLLFQSSYVLPRASLFDLQLQKQTKPFKPNVKGYEEEWGVIGVWAEEWNVGFHTKERL